MAKRNHLIIGCGPAAFSAVQTMRRLSSENEVTLITREKHLPYSLAALPYLVSGKTSEADLWQADEDYLQKMGCSLIREKEVVEVAPKSKQVVCKDGERIAYDTLLIASGSHPSSPDIKGLDKVKFFSFHTLDDCRLLKRELEGKKDVIIYGAGLVATELAIALLDAGYRVKIVVRSRILRRYFEPDAGQMIEDLFREKGAQVYKGHTIDEVKKNKGKIEVILSDGSAFATEVLILAVGVKPSSLFLQGTGIELADGAVLVDNRMKTNIEDIYAAGDIAAAPDFFAGEQGLNAILPSAISQGKIAGANMVGQETKYEGWISRNILNFFGNTAFSIGLQESEGAQILKEIGRERKQYKKLIYRDGNLLGAVFINSEVFPGVFQYLIEKRVNLGEYAELLFRKPKDTSLWLMLENERKESLSLEE
ncbi:MAG: FAD-dependent oxidoreductase [Chloroflexota bacterium]|nr:FAD-dependent oxidoreductase [Chloroflexota bacterium]